MDQNIEDLVKTTTRGSLILLAGQVSSTFILALGMLLVARFLGDSAYGSFNKAQSVVQIGFLIINLGINNALIKYLAQYRHEGKHGYLRVLIEAGIILNITVSILLTLIVYLISGYVANNIYHDPSQEFFIKYLSIGIIGQAFVNLANGITVGYERMELRSAIQLCYSFVKSMVSPVLVYLGFGVMGAVLGHTAPILLSGIVGAIFIVFLYRKERSAEIPISHLEAMKMILGYGFPLYLSILLGGILPHVYTTLLGIWETDSQIGNYSVVLNFSVLLSFVTIPISTTIFPLFSKLEKNWKQLSFLYRNAVKYSTLFGYPIIFTIMSLADQIINILFQDRFIYASNYLRIYMLTFTFIGVGSVCNGSLLSSQKRTDLIFQSTLARFIVSLPLSLFAISRFGVVGLLGTYFVSTGINTLIDYYNVKRVFDFSINWTFFYKIFILSILSSFIVYQLVTILVLHPWIELLLGGFTSVFIYLIGLLALKALNVNDFGYLKQICSSFGPLSPVVRWLIDILIKFS
jgi:O-antigen/teichoic acid export membrane protein